MVPSWHASEFVHRPLNRWRDIIDSLPDALVVLSPEYQPVAANPAAETMLGVTPLTTALILDLIRTNDWLSHMVETCLATGQGLGDAETELHVGPRSIAVRAEVAPIAREDGTTEQVIVFLHDLSHQKTAERVSEAKQLELRLSPAGLAHEVKNPLTGIKGAAELLSGMFPSDIRAQQYCTVILEGVNRIASLVEQVLAVGSPQRLAADPVNVHQVLHGALRLAGFYPQAPAGVNIIQDFDPSLPEITGDSGALERALLNLIKNAAEAIQGAGTIRLHTRMETEFRVTAEGRHQQFLRIEISDSGPGLSDAEVTQLFTPFFTTKPTGTGLGLVLSQRIVASHGGRLMAERRSERDLTGMTFRVTLPVATSEPPR